MTSILVEAIQEVMEKVLCNNEAIVKLEGTDEPTQVAGCLETNSKGETVIGIYLYVCGKAIFKFQDIGTVITV